MQPAPPHAHAPLVVCPGATRHVYDTHTTLAPAPAPNPWSLPALSVAVLGVVGACYLLTLPSSSSSLWTLTTPRVAQSLPHASESRSRLHTSLNRDIGSLLSPTARKSPGIPRPRPTLPTGAHDAGVPASAALNGPHGHESLSTVTGAVSHAAVPVGGLLGIGVLVAYFFGLWHKSQRQADPVVDLQPQPLAMCSTTSTHNTNGGESLPTWESLAPLVPTAQDPGPEVLGIALDQPPAQSGRLILYRDRNGWCPYSERVWLGMMEKGLEFDEVLINLQGRKPKWYYDEVRTGNTPAIRFPDGTVMWESLDLLKELDVRYPAPEYPALFPTDPDERAEAEALIQAFSSTMPSNSRPSSRAAFLFRGWGGDLIPKGEIVQTFDRLEKLLAKHPAGPFFMGAQFTAVECCWAPFLERYTVQVPLLHEGIDLTDASRWPLLNKWFQGMHEQVSTYLPRVKGDSHTWSYALAEAVDDARRYPGLRALMKGDQRHVAAELEVLDAGDGSVWDEYCKARPGVAATPALEAAARVLRNHEAIKEDALAGCATQGVTIALVDKVLRCLVVLLTSEYMADPCSQCKSTLLLAEAQTLCVENISPEEGPLAADVARFLAGRLCVPRDMGSLPAAHFRACLALLRDSLTD